MLPVKHRLRSSAEFSAVTRGPGGARAGSHLLVVHASQTDPQAQRPPRVGLVVSRAVGGAVTRNLVKRRLRASMAERIGAVPAGMDVVVRAQGTASAATHAELTADLGRLLGTAVDRAAVKAMGRR